MTVMREEDQDKQDPINDPKEIKKNLENNEYGLATEDLKNQLKDKIILEENDLRDEQDLTQQVVSDIVINLRNSNVPEEFYDRIIHDIVSNLSDDCLAQGVIGVKKSVDETIEGSIKLEKEQVKKEQNQEEKVKKLEYIRFLETFKKYSADLANVIYKRYLEMQKNAIERLNGVGEQEPKIAKDVSLIERIEGWFKV